MGNGKKAIKGVWEIGFGLRQRGGGETIDGKNRDLGKGKEGETQKKSEGSNMPKDAACVAKGRRKFRRTGNRVL